MDENDIDQDDGPNEDDVDEDYLEKPVDLQYHNNEEDVDNEKLPVVALEKKKALENNSKLDTSLSLQPNVILNQSKMNYAYINKSVSLSEELVAERELNLSNAPSGEACESVTNNSCVDA